MPNDPMTDERLAEIEALTQQFDASARIRLAAAVPELLAALRQARAERDAALTALEPFAAYVQACRGVGMHPLAKRGAYPDSVVMGMKDAELTAADFERAADALRQQEGADDTG